MNKIIVDNLNDRVAGDEEDFLSISARQSVTEARLLIHLIDRRCFHASRLQHSVRNYSDDNDFMYLGLLHHIDTCTCTV